MRFHLAGPYAGRHRLRRWHVYVAALIALAGALAVVIAYQAGRESAPRYTASYFLHVQKVQLNLQAPPPSLAAVPAAPVSAPAQPVAAVPRSQMDAPLIQGSLGQCECYAFRAQLEHLLKKHGFRLQYSCRFWYPIVTLGRDIGSFLEQFITTLQTVGGVPHRTFDYQGYPTESQFSLPLAQQFLAVAAQHRYTLSEHAIAQFPGGGESVVNACEREILADRTCNLGMNVYTGDPSCGGALDANENAGLVDLPRDIKLCSTPGGHAVTIWGYNRNLCLNGPDGPWCGWMYFQNSWGANYGVNCTTLQPDVVHGGCGLISTRLVAQDGYDVAAIKLQPNSLPRSGPPIIPRNHSSPAADPGFPAPPGASAMPLPAPALASGRHYVYHLYAKDTGVDLAPSIDYWADRAGLDPLGFAATILTECGGYTTSTTCDSDRGGLDNSYGDCQVTITTAYGLAHLGNGVWDGINGPNRNLVRTYENVPSQCQYLAHLLLAQYSGYLAQTCPGASQFPQLYVAWNAGAYAGCAYLLNPWGTQAGTNYQNYLNWYRVAAQYVSGSTNPYTRPKPFPLAQWRAWCVRHPRKACQSPYYHGGISWAAGVWFGNGSGKYRQLGGVVGRERYVTRLGKRRLRHPFTTTAFQHGSITCWSSYGRCAVDPR